jgi:hypothetical protein
MPQLRSCLTVDQLNALGRGQKFSTPTVMFSKLTARSKRRLLHVYNMGYARRGIPDPISE